MFLYCEDTDLSWRLRLAGYRVLDGPGRAGAARVRVRAQHRQVLPPRAQPPADGGRELRGAARCCALVPGLLATELALSRSRCAAAGGGASSRPTSRRCAPGASCARSARGSRCCGVSPDREVAAHFARRLGPEFGEGVARASAGLLAAYARARAALLTAIAALQDQLDDSELQVMSVSGLGQPDSSSASITGLSGSAVQQGRRSCSAGRARRLTS